MTHLTDQKLQDYIFSSTPYLHPEDQAHLSGCSECKSRLESYSWMHHHLRQMEDPALHPRVYESIYHQLTRKEKPAIKIPWHIPLTTFAAGIVLFFLPKVDFGYELPIQLSLGIAAAAVIIGIEIKFIELIYKQKINQVR